MRATGSGACTRTACHSGRARSSRPRSRESRMRRLKPATAAEHMLEIVTPRTNAARLTSAEHLFGALGAGTAGDAAPVSLEIVGDAERRRFLVRTSSSTELRRVAGQLGSAYPQAILRPFDASALSTGDPARLG